MEMRFTEQEIKAAQQLEELGLPWTPQAGHYVLDPTEFCKAPSPFQDRVYFILNYPYFMKAAGGVDRFKEMMTWLPTWYDARLILKHLEISDQEIPDPLDRVQAIIHGTERLELYKLIAEQLAPTSESVENI